MSENCELGNLEDNLRGDLFLANMQDPGIQMELLKETVEPAQALRLENNMDLGPQNQRQISKSKSKLQVNAIVPQRQFLNSNQRQTF